MVTLNVDRDAVLRAVAEWQRLGRDELLEQYGFGPAKRYFLVLDGNYYDSKAIVGVAQTLNGGPRLTAADFSGGESTVGRLLTKLGFTVERIDEDKHSRTVTAQNLGAWVMKCDPDAWDIENFIRDRNRVIEDWRVVPNYRSRMMRTGQKVLLWQTGPDADWRGFRGAGWITGKVREFPTAEVLADDSYWIDREMLSRSELLAPMNLEVWDYPISEMEMLEKHPELAGIEVVRMRQCSNPSWVSREHLAMVQDLVAINPDMPNPSITVGAQGAGYGSIESRWVVEDAAIDAVTSCFLARDYSVSSVESEKVGWDLTCESPAGSITHVEVKGVSGADPSVLLTRHEVAVAQDDPTWILAVVTSALSAPHVQFFERERVVAHADPTVFRAELPESGWEPFDEGIIVYSSETK